MAHFRYYTVHSNQVFYKIADDRIQTCIIWSPLATSLATVPQSLPYNFVIVREDPLTEVYLLYSQKIFCTQLMPL